jgi:hypothetical protein
VWSIANPQTAIAAAHDAKLPAISVVVVIGVVIIPVASKAVASKSDDRTAAEMTMGTLIARVPGPPRKTRAARRNTAPNAFGRAPPYRLLSRQGRRLSGRPWMSRRPPAQRRWQAHRLLGRRLPSRRLLHCSRHRHLQPHRHRRHRHRVAHQPSWYSTRAVAVATKARFVRLLLHYKFPPRSGHLPTLAVGGNAPDLLK